MTAQRLSEAIHMWWADPAAAPRYSPHALSVADQVRANHPRTPKVELEWRVSRALLAHVRQSTALVESALSLSHSQGHALCGQTIAGVHLGVDLERLRPRDVRGLAAWICDTGECDALERLSHDQDKQSEFFYLLWTLKEAFIKAARLRFPVGMRTVGLRLIPGQAARLRAPEGRWQARAFRLDHDWVAAVVWRNDVHPAITGTIWHAGPASRMPACRLLGSWSCDG
jgi:4'-phosphopantetheinyl transferase